MRGFTVEKFQINESEAYLCLRWQTSAATPWNNSGKGKSLSANNLRRWTDGFASPHSEAATAKACTKPEPSVTD